MNKGIIIGVVALLVVGVILFQFFKESSPQILVGEEILEVKITMDNGVALSKIEVDLWKAGSQGHPDAGYNFTDDEGIVIFKIPDGEYEIGFNLNNFPENLICPEKEFVLVEKGVPASKIILIKAQQN